jgi:hypothetical protein
MRLDALLAVASASPRRSLGTRLGSEAVAQQRPKLAWHFDKNAYRDADAARKAPDFMLWPRLGFRHSSISNTCVCFGSSTNATVASAAGLFVGMKVSTKNLPINCTITAINGTTLSLSNPATNSATAAARFSSLTDAQTLGATGGALSATTTLVTANLPTFTSSAANNISVTVNPEPGISIPASSGTLFSSATGSGANSGVAQTGGSTFTGISSMAGTTSNNITVTSQGTTSTPIVKSVMQPTIVMNYIIKR